MIILIFVRQSNTLCVIATQSCAAIMNCYLTQGRLVRREMICYFAISNNLHEKDIDYMQNIVRY